MDRETPRSVMFDDLRKFGGITNRDTAWMLLRSTPMAGGKAPRDRVDERTFLSREVVHAPSSVRAPSCLPILPRRPKTSPLA